MSESDGGSTALAAEFRKIINELLLLLLEAGVARSEVAEEVRCVLVFVCVVFFVTTGTVEAFF
jgi:hypothetical protein